MYNNDSDLLEKSILKIGEFNRFGSRPGLERVSELLRRLDNPQKDLKVIHVGGTNGKGSVCRYVYSALQAAGYKTGLFISPYIERFTERIEFDGKEISAEDLWEITERVVGLAAAMVAEGLESPTEFEVLTAIAFCYYRMKSADLVVLEVGLGGRGDSTNVVKNPLVTCIASVSFDHMDYLGDTLEKIAWEKAGIIKAGCPIVFTAEDSGAKRVIEETAAKQDAPLLDCSESYIEILRENIDGTVFSARIGNEVIKDLRVSMPGRHQLRNAVCAMEILRILREQYDLRIPDDCARLGLATARQPGRIEIMCREPLIIIDGSHNYDSVRALTDWTKKNFDKDDRILIVTGVLRDKQYDSMAEMLGEIGTDFIVTEPDNPRKLAAELYAETLKKYASPKSIIMTEKNLNIATQIAISKHINKENSKNNYKALIFTGSLYMIGIVRKKIKGILTEVSR